MIRRLRNILTNRGWLALGFGLIVGTSQAGEIIVGPGAKTPSVRDSARDSAAEQRERARSQRDNLPSVPAQTVIIVDDEEGPYGTRRGDGAATDNRNRARMYQKGNDGPAPRELERALGLEADTPQNRAANALDKARAYQRGESPATSGMSRFGSNDKLPLVDCAQTENVSARIGDDNVSGSVITLMRDGKGVRVRCK